MSILQTSLKSNKKALRKAMAETLKELKPSDMQAQSQAIATQVISSPHFERAKTVSCYLSMPTGEVDTSTLVTEILRDSGKSLFVPMINSGKMSFVKLYSEDDLNTLPVGLWNIKEPTPTWDGQNRQDILDRSCDPLDLILVPGVAFDRTFSRLGHGKGYYDKFIASYTSRASNEGKSTPFLMALAFKQQLTGDDQVPVADYDWKMDMIVTPDETIVSNMALAASN